MTSNTELDGSIVINIVVPLLQESKCMKFNPSLRISEMKQAITQKFVFQGLDNNLLQKMSYLFITKYLLYIFFK